MLKKFGINIEGESIKYFREADYLINEGTFSSPKYWFYSSYIFVHIIFKYLGFEIWGCYLFQSFLNLASILFFYKALLQVIHSNKLVFFICLYLATLFPLQQFNTHLYTESLFISFSTIWAGLLLFSLKRNQHIGLLFVIAILLLFTRPSGIYFIILSICWIIILLAKSKKYQWAISIFTITVLLGAVSINKMMQTGGELDFWLPYEEKHIICGVPTGIMEISNDNKENIFLFYKVFIQYPKETTQLMLKRLYSFWKITRDHYSFSHNLVLMIWFYPLYILALFSLRLIKKNVFIQLIILACLLFSLSIMFTCDDWMNRFILPLVPLLLIATAINLNKKSLG